MFFCHARLMPMDAPVIPDGWLEIRDGTIRALGPMQELPAVPDGASSLQGALVLPGWIDIHCHLGMFGDGLRFEGDDGNEETDPVTPHLRAIDAVNPFDRCFSDALDAGVTTVLTGPGSTNPIAGQWAAMKTYGLSVDEMAFRPYAGMKFSLGENPKNSYNSREQTPITRMGIAALIREQLKKAVRYQEALARSQADPEVDPPEYDMKCEALLPLLRREGKAFFHAHRADDILTALRIAREFGLDPVIVHATEGFRVASLLARERAGAVVGPILMDRGKPELCNQSPSNAACLTAAGVPTAICTDHPENPIQYLTLEAAVCVKHGLPPEQALRSITLDAARIAGIDDRVGSLTPGKDADLLVFDPDADPLCLMTDPRCVLVEGHPVRGTLPDC